MNDTIHLRAIEPEDLGFLYEIENDPSLWSVGTPTAPYSHYALKQYLESQPQDLFQTKQLRMIIEREGKSVGILDLFNYNANDGRAEVGISILKSERGKGIATQALKKLEQHARRLLNLHQLYALVSTSANPSSNRVFEKSGYKNIATLPQWHFINGSFEDISVFQLFLD